MQALTPAGQNIVQDISQRYGLSFDSAAGMLVAVNNGGGSMAQFSCPELGSGQWMRGGMTMVSDMFNHGLKNTVNNLCSELSNALANHQVFQPSAQGGRGNNWWPAELGHPSGAGSQNHIRYAVFPQAQRLLVERDGQITTFNTLNHHISGVSQQQGGGSSLTFTSQFGTISTLSLPLISGPGLLPQEPQNNFAARPVPVSEPAPSFQPDHPQPPNSGSGSGDVVTLLEKLGQLRDAGVLTPEEFASKKAELLSRL